MTKQEKQAYAAECEMQGFPQPRIEHRFHPHRKWPFDFAWPAQRVALEVDGGIYQGSGPPCEKCGRRPPAGHNSIAGIKRDHEKSNAAIELSWYVLRVTPDELYLARTHQLIRTVLTNRGWRPATHRTA